MAVENRVRDLENEVKILKNEIKTILLNIQDHVLTHYSSPFVAAPALQAVAKQEVAVSGVTQSATSSRQGTLSVVDRLDEAVADTPAADNGAETPVPEPRSSSMEDLMRGMLRPDTGGDSGGSTDLVHALSGTSEALSRTPGDSLGQPQSDETWLGSLRGDVDLGMLSRLSDWVNDTSQVLGGQRTKTMLDTYAMTGLISPNVVKLLGLFVSFDDGEATEGKISSKAILTALLNLDKTLGRKVDATAVALSLLLDGE